MLSLIIGLIFFALGLYGVVVFWEYVVNVILGLGSVSIMLAGIVGIIAGISSLSQRLTNKIENKK
jgi:hypothetical protein